MRIFAFGLLAFRFVTVSDKEFKIMGKTFPQWKDEIEKSNLELIRLWAK